jgi:hypothetical protein
VCALKILMGSKREMNTMDIEYYGEASGWDLFELNEIQMHVEYVNDMQSIQLISLMKSSTVPNQKREGARRE